MQNAETRKNFLFRLMILVLSCGFLNPAESLGQRNPAFYNYPYHHLDWYTIESDHFLVHFQEGNSRPAQVISRIAEEVYGPITELYQHRPDEKVHILLIDRLDYSNGAAFFYDNKIEIWLPALDTPLRGTHNWLRNVITHEFTHMVQLQAAMKQSRRRPAVYLQWLSYEDVRRPDVLYGFPNGIITYPLSGITMPAWLAEGTAQYMRSEIYYDDWDSHRDMLLRTRILDGNHLGFEEMGTFYSKTSLERELVYNQGFAFTRYLSERFGEESLASITRSFTERGMHDISVAIKQATGISGKQLFEEWVEELKHHYNRFSENREKNPENRVWIEPHGFFNFHPSFHPNTGQVAYISNRSTYSSFAALILKDPDSLNTREAYQAHLFEESLSADSHSHPLSHSRSHGEAAPASAIYAHRRPFASRSAAKNTALRNHSAHGHACQLHSSLFRRLETSYSFSPDGKFIAYSRADINRHGERYRDLYLYDLESGNRQRLTYSKRLQDPAWSPKGGLIAAGKIHDGSINLVLYNPEEDTLSYITRFDRGEQIYRPVWHPDGNSLYFAYADTSRRGIYRIFLNQDKMVQIADTSENEPSPISPGNPEPVLTAATTGLNTDFRDPVIDAQGRWLYFSADPDGVFNIFRKELSTGQVQKITNVTGGAFMPYPHPEDQRLLYSEFTSGGYKIALVDLSSKSFDTASFALSSPATPEDNSETFFTGENTVIMPAAGRFNPPLPKEADQNRSLFHALNDFDDSDIEPIHQWAKAIADTGIYHYQLPTIGSSAYRQLYRYDDQFTIFQFYPVIRFDNYSRLRGGNLHLATRGQWNDLGANLWRDFKAGTYVSSREMRERFSLFGGILVGPGSRSSDGISNFFKPGRLVNLDRDLFFEVEYSGLPFLKRHWSPTASIGFFNIRRNVQNGLQLEEFPCTACLPDTTSIDIAYNMWQVEASLISKINQWSLAELGYYYSPYRVSTDSFYSREYRQEIPGSTSRYYIGSTWSAAWIYRLSRPEPHSDIAPLGWRGLLRYRYEPSELLDSYDVRDGVLIPVYNRYKNHSIEAEVRSGFIFARQRFNIRSRFFTYFDGPDEYFYLDYIGGMIGMRSYPYFALGGTTTAFTQLSWFLPLKTNIYRQKGRFTADKIFLRLFAEAGNGWGGPLDIDRSVKTGVGAEMRVGMNSYYLFPTRFFMSAAYGFNSFDLRLPDAFITETPSGRVSYGNKILINFGLLFEFDF